MSFVETCATCNGEGMIYRPELDIEHFIPTEDYDACGDLVIDERLAITKSGGIDACPACAAKAEIAFRDRIQTSTEDHDTPQLRVIK